MTTDTSYRVPAEIFSDDRVYTVKFEAEGWFQAASDEEILALAGCDWGGDCPADEVAHWAGMRDERIDRVLGYCQSRAHSREPVGFEVHVDEKAAREWLSKYRPYLVGLIDAEVEDEGGYRELVNQIWQEAKKDPLLEEFGNALKEATAEYGLSADGPADVSCDWYYSLNWFLFEEEDEGNRVSVEFRLHPSLEYDGNLAGVNFGVSAISPYGVILFDRAPYNYTSACWVPVTDKEAVRRRFHESLEISLLRLCGEVKNYLTSEGNKE